MMQHNADTFHLLHLFIDRNCSWAFTGKATSPPSCPSLKSPAEVCHLNYELLFSLCFTFFKLTFGNFVYIKLQSFMKK